MNNSNVKIRKAEEGDYEAVNALYYDTYDYYHQNIPDRYKKTPQKTLPQGTFLNMVEDKNVLLIVAEVDGKVIGVLYATIEKEEADKWTNSYRRVSVDELSIDAKFRTRGIGSELMQEAEKWAVKKGIKDMTVLVYSFNKNAIAFYEKNDFIPYSIQLDKKI